MLEHSKAFSGFAASDLGKVKEFYAITLGLKVTEEHGLLTLHLAGGSKIAGLTAPQPTVRRTSLRIRRGLAGEKRKAETLKV